VISYPWATALVYRAYGETPPPPAGGAARGGEPRTGGVRVEGLPIEMMVATAAERMPGWKSISIALPAPTASRVVMTLDSGDGGQPQKRATLTLDRQTGAPVRWEPFSSQSSGRKARTWLRFAHTGEVYGLLGQTFAGLVTAGSTVLMWTGLALALRRFAQWRKRSSHAMSKAA
jgi:uncharacterized iron-regulated membrane protein